MEMLSTWQYLSNWDYEPGGFDPGQGGLFDTSFNVVGAVEGQWASDLNIPVDCWSACSLLRITEELLKANYICSLKCNVCCSLCSYELAEALNSISNASSNTLGQYGPRNARQPVLLGDRLALSVLFTNPNIGVRPIDLRLHFSMFIAGDWSFAKPGQEFPNTIQPGQFMGYGDWSNMGACAPPPAGINTTPVGQINPIGDVPSCASFAGDQNWSAFAIHSKSCTGNTWLELQNPQSLEGKTMTIIGEEEYCPWNGTATKSVTLKIIGGISTQGEVVNFKSIKVVSTTPLKFTPPDSVTKQYYSRIYFS